MKMHILRMIVALGLACGTMYHCAFAQQDRKEETIHDEDIVVTSFPEVVYPPVPRSAVIESIVVVKVKLDETGNVVSSTALSGAEVLIPYCLSNAKKWQFRPNPGKAAVIIYEFRIEKGACYKDKSSFFVLRKPNIASVTGCQSIWQP